MTYKPTEDDIHNQQEQLAAHRRTLAGLLVQQAGVSQLHAKPEITNGIRESREAIARIKATLREWGISVSNHPDDRVNPTESVQDLKGAIERGENTDVQMEALNQQVAEREKQTLDSGPVRQQMDKWRAYLPRIDFDKATDTVRRVLRQYKTGAGAALFLMHNCADMEGRLFLEALNDELGNEARKIKRHPITLDAYDTLDRTLFLGRLYQGLTAQQYSHICDSHLPAVLDLLCDHIEDGRVLFLEVLIDSDIAAFPDFIEWFVEHFWGGLLQRWPHIKEHNPDTLLVVVLATSAALPFTKKEFKQKIPRLCQRATTYKLEHIIELQLENWKEDEIRAWLSRYSGWLTDEPDNQRRQQKIKKTARTLYANHKGKPVLVRGGLQQLLGSRE